MARITTNPRIFRQPSPTGEVFAYCDNLLTQPHCEIVRPGERHWEVFTRLCTETGTRGPRISDAWFAALAIEHGSTWIICGRYAGRRDMPAVAGEQEQIAGDRGVAGRAVRG